MTTKDKSHRFLIDSVKSELSQGTKHYDSREPDMVVTRVQTIIELMVTGFLQIRPTEKRGHLFDRFLVKNGHVPQKGA